MADQAWATRLRDVFGAALQTVTREHVERLVTSGAREWVDLDFKQELYGNSDSQKRELAADIAAMRNDGAGVIVLGVAEEDGAAVATPEVDLSDAEEARMRQAVASLTAPHAAFEIVRVKGESEERGFYLLIAPPSPYRPHAVVVDTNLRFPRRDGTTKRWLSETEVADMYRDRFRGERRQLDRLDTITNEALAMVSREDTPWVIAALVPNLSGALRINFAGRAEIEQWAQTEHCNDDRVDGFFAGALPRAGVGVDRYTLSLHGEHGRPEHMYAECHIDGAAAAAVVIYQRGDGGEDATTVFATDLLRRVVRALRLIGRHAVANAGAYGDATVELRVVGRNMALGYHDPHGMFPQRYTNGLLVNDARSRHTLPLESLAGEPQALFAAAKIMLGQIFNAFGRAEIGHIADDGTLRLRYFGSDQQQLAAWAVDRGVATTEETVSE